MIEKINNQNIKNLSYEQLDLLASEIRNEIISVVSKNGGHLSSNLGMVELTIALHKVFDSPKDKIIFDVSHQCYAHKIITGRYNDFSLLRKYNGISGFTKYSESIHDAYEAGHSSTSISAGLGFLEAKKTFKDEIGEVIAVVGDASIVNGLSFEALNYLGAHKDEKMIIILNDNNMGISKNVGSIAQRYNQIRAKGKLKLIRNIAPLKLKKALRSAFNEIEIFNLLGFQYFEKIDGHNILELTKYLNYAKESTQSVVLHVVTQKGKGYLPAEVDVFGLWHGVNSFDIETGKIDKDLNKTTFGNVLGDYLIKYCQNGKNKDLIRVITPAMMLGSGLTNFSKTFSNKFIDVGIAEENAAVMAGAMAHSKLIPILFMYSTFAQRAYDEILHDIARTNEHVIICLDHAGIVGNDGDTHQGIYDVAYLKSIPGIKIFAPSSIDDAISMLKYSIDELDGPVVIRYSKEKIEFVPKYKYKKPTWELLRDDQTIVITYGIMVSEVAKLNVGLINAKVLTKLDEELLDQIKDKNIIVYEEVISNSSLGQDIINYYFKKGVHPNIHLMCLPNTYLPTATRLEILEKYDISINDLKKVVESYATKLNG